MADVPELTERHLHQLAVIAANCDVLLFDLEHRELIEAGLVSDDRGVLRLTRLGKATLRLVEELEVA